MQLNNSSQEIFMSKLSGVWIVLLLFFFFNIILAQSEEEAIIKTVQQFFDAMAARETSATLDVLLPDGQYFSIREDSLSVSIKKTTHIDYLNRLATFDDRWIEKMTEPEVLIDNRVAVLWTNYDFYRNGQFSHCGIDAFSLLKSAEGWKIVGFIYSVETTDCQK
jgi:hypothetical protein